MDNKINRQLLCKFSNNSNYIKHIDIIKNECELIDNKIFIFINEKNIKEMFLTFLMDKQKRRLYEDKLSTISIHRKKETNTLYTLNAMNKLITEENDGVFDRSYTLSWELYKNCLILNNNVGVRIYPIKLFNLIKF